MVDLIYIRLSNIFNIQFNRCGCSIHSNVLSISRLDCSIWLHVLFPRSPAGPPLLIRRSRLPLPSSTNYYASIVNTSCFDRRVDLLFRTRKRREETGIRTADLILIHDLENDALDRSATVGRLQTYFIPLYRAYLGRMRYEEHIKIRPGPTSIRPENMQNFLHK